MRGSMRERSSGRWEMRVYIGRHPISGNPRQVSRTFEGSRRQAEQALRKFITEVENNEVKPRPVNDSGHNLTALMERFLRMRPLADSTKKAYSSSVNNHIGPYMGHTNVQQVTTAQLNEFYRYLVEVDELAPSTIRRINAFLSSAFEFGISEAFGGLTDNPCRRTMLPRLTKKQVIAPSVEQVHRMLDPTAHSDPEFLLACRLAAATGARRGEICGLRWVDVRDDRQLHIVRSVWDAGGGKLIVKEPKGGLGRQLTLDWGTWAMLGEIRRDPTLSPRDYIISGGPEPYSPNQLTLKWMRLCERLGMTGFRFHDLRHFHATILLSSGEVSIATVSKRLGHANVSTTLNIYAHAIPEREPITAKVLGEIFHFEHEAKEPQRIRPLRLPPEDSVGDEGEDQQN